MSASLDKEDSNRGSELIRFVQSDSGQHFILNSNIIKSVYETKYSNGTSGEFKFILPMEISLHFPEMKRFDLESLEWEPIEPYAPQLAPFRADTPNELHQHWNSARPVPQSKPIKVIPMDPAFIDHPHIHTLGKIKLLAKSDKPCGATDMKKLVLDYINDCYVSIQSFISQNIRLVREELEDHSVFGAFDFQTSFEWSRLTRPIKPDKRGKCLREVEQSAVYEGWIAEIDKYVMDVYNEGCCESFCGSLLRYKVDVLAGLGCQTLVMVMVKRMVEFCKVMSRALFIVVIENMQLFA